MLIRRVPTEAEIAARARELHEQQNARAAARADAAWEPWGGDPALAAPAHDDQAAREAWERAKAELEAAEAAAESDD